VVVERGELSAWLRLISTPQFGRVSARRLLAEFGSPEAVLNASVSQRAEFVGLGPATALAREPEGLAALVDATWSWLQSTERGPRSVITLGDPDYPAMLLEAADPPLLLHAAGRTELLAADALAIVGSRNPTPQGLLNATAFAENLGDAGWVIVSGLALGIDAAAHEGALKTQGSTIAVVGTGLDRVYPRRHHELAHRIATDGLLLSEYPIGSPPVSAHFPQRNRIIAGLTRGTLVVEAAVESGSLITARLASEGGRDVFAVPGSIHSPQSRGCHALIKQGAKLVESAQDILDELPTCAAPPAARTEARIDPPSNAAGEALLNVMGFDPIGLDELQARTGESTRVLNIRLLELELDGRVARLPGQRFQQTRIA
jgi:DNA processing protein